MSTNQQNQSQNQIPPQPTIDQLIQEMRKAESQAHSDAQYMSLSNFDKLVDQLRIFSAQINDRNMEVARLQELCTKNNVDTTPPAPAPVKLAANEAVIPSAVTPGDEAPIPVVATAPNVDNL